MHVQAEYRAKHEVVFRLVTIVVKILNSGNCDRSLLVALNPGRLFCSHYNNNISMGTV